MSATAAETNHGLGIVNQPLTEMNLGVQADIKTEALDQMPDVSTFVELSVLGSLRRTSNQVTKLIIGSESGVGKGLTLSQIISILRQNSKLHLQASNSEFLYTKAGEPVQKVLHPFYSSTALLYKAALERQEITTKPGEQPTWPELHRAAEHANAVLALAEATLPIDDPNRAHLSLEELVVVIGEKIIARQALHQNTFLLLFKTNPDILNRSYLQRKAKFAGKKARTVFDLPPEEVRTTSGTDKSIEVVCKEQNEQMYKAFVAGKLQLPYSTPNAPDGRLWDAVLAEMSPRKLHRFFTNLTRFSDKGVKVHELREHLQEAFYLYKLHEWGLNDAEIAKRVLIAMPPFIENEDVHAYPGLLNEIALDLSGESARKLLPKKKDVFIAADITRE